MAFAAICTPKGYESLARGLPWVWGFSATRPEGAPESKLAGTYLEPLAR